MTALMVRRALADYARRPLNLVLLVAVPLVLVFVWGGTLADFSKLLGGNADRGQIEAATAGWAAAALAGLAGFFQVTGSRAADRRLAAAGRRTAPSSSAAWVRRSAWPCWRRLRASSRWSPAPASPTHPGDRRDPAGRAHLPRARGPRWHVRAIRHERRAADHIGLDPRRVLRPDARRRVQRVDPSLSAALPDPGAHRPGQRARGPPRRRRLVARLGDRPLSRRHHAPRRDDPSARPRPKPAVPSPRPSRQGSAP